jgi:DNA glycosylase AlkZ-like
VDALGVVRRRLVAQRLARAPFASPAEAVRSLVAVQGQEWSAAKWSLAQRCTPGTTDAAVEAALAGGELLRTHVLRPTWHLVAPRDLRWLLALTAPRVHARNAAYYRAHALDEALLTRGDAVLGAALEDGRPRTRAELGEALGAAGIEARGTRLAHLVMHAELEGVLCSGPRRGAQHTYALVDHRVAAPRPFDRTAAVAQLAERYVTGHGPARPRDLAWWSGLTVADARAGLAAAGDRLEHRDGWFAAPGVLDAEPDVRGALLLAMYDEATIAFREPRIVRAADGEVERPVLVDGRAVGSWRRTVRGHEMAIEVGLLIRLGRLDRRALTAAVERYAGFLERPVTLRLSP